MSIYFLVSCDQRGVLTDDIVKIGYSEGNTPRRLYDVGTGCPVPLELYAVIEGDKALEAEIHRLFTKDHIHKEWFWWTHELEDWIDNREIDESLAARASA